MFKKLKDKKFVDQQDVLKEAAKSKNSKIARAVRNWYADRYLSLIVQRNFLFFFTVVAAMSVLLALILVKTMYEQRSIDPYLIEVEKDTGIMTIVDYSTSKEYTAQEAVKESLLKAYVKNREGYDLGKIDDMANMVRVLSNQNIYALFTQGDGLNKRDVRTYGQNPKTEVVFRQISYLSPTRVEVRFNRVISADDKKEKLTKKHSAIIGFTFADMEMGLEDRALNPLGFQVVTYISREEKESMDDSS